MLTLFATLLDIVTGIGQTTGQDLSERNVTRPLLALLAALFWGLLVVVALIEFI